MTAAYKPTEKTDLSKTPIVRVDSLTRTALSKWKSFDSQIPDLVHINTAAHWNYQRDRVFIRSGIAPAKVSRKRKARQTVKRHETVITLEAPDLCLECGGK